jgi:membrane-associated phospholipid phosphatase
MLGLGSFVAGLSAEFIKRFITVNQPIFRRPKGARACDILCCGGAAEHESGMPSAHASTTAFAATYLFLTCQNPYITTVAIAYWLAVCYARYKKRCHTPAQLAAGTILGMTLAYLATIVSH